MRGVKINSIPLIVPVTPPNGGKLQILKFENSNFLSYFSSQYATKIGKLKFLQGGTL
jgi:ribosomal protein RSM22 (predicted rRNA methylase)